MNEQETVYLVDSSDNVIGSKLRDRLTDDDCWRIVTVWIENSRGEVLLQQRSMSKKLSPGLWTPAASGTVKLGDSYLETAIREVAEEIGLASVELTQTNKLYCKHPFGSRQEQGFTALCNWPIEDFTPQLSEVSQLQWVAKSQVLDEISGKTPPTRDWTANANLWIKLFNLA